MASARKYGHDTRDWEDRPLRIVDGEYPIFPGVHLAFSPTQDFWVREQRGEVTRRFKAVVGGCSAGFRDDFGILTSGDVTTCCVDYDGKNVIGNLHTQSVMEVLESDEARRIERSFRRFVPPTPFCRERPRRAHARVIDTEAGAIDRLRPDGPHRAPQAVRGSEVAAGRHAARGA